MSSRLESLLRDPEHMLSSRQITRLHAEISRLETEVTRLKTEIRRLETEITRLETITRPETED